MRDSEMVTQSFNLLNQIEEPDTEVKKRRRTHRKKRLDTEIYTEIIKSSAKVSVAVVFLFCTGFKAQVGYSHHPGTVNTNTQCEYQQEKCVQYMEAQND